MIVRETDLADARLIDIEPRGDERGMFARTFCSEEFAAAGLETVFVQQNTSVSRHRGTVRGMHYQRPPHAEAKLVRCVRGAICDVIVDMRRGSPTFLRHQAFELTAENRRQLFIPKGFAHGFQTLADDTEVNYLMSTAYAPGTEGGVRHDDPLLDIRWPLPVGVIADKDSGWPLIDSATYRDF